MTSYMSLFQSAAADIGLFYPALAVNVRQGLRWLSEAVHTYQVETGAVRCTETFDLIPEGTEGIYPISKCPEVIFLAEYLSSDDANPQFPAIVDWETFERKKSDWYLGSRDISVIDSVPIMLSFRGATVHIFPYDGISGSIRLDFKPALTPYDPTNPVDEWAKFGKTPEGAMAVNTYPVEFRAAEEGIKAYCMGKMIKSIPNYRKAFPGEYEEQYALFRDGIRRIIRKNPPQDLDVRTRVAMGPVM